MRHIKSSFTAWIADRRAVTALEYGLIAAAVVAVGLTGFSVLEQNLSDKFNSVGDMLASPPEAVPNP